MSVRFFLAMTRGPDVCAILFGNDKGSRCLCADGGWSRGLKHGEGTLVHSTGEMYTGMWKHDVKEGEGTMVGKTLTVRPSPLKR